jgi:hypothetical protein
MVIADMKRTGYSGYARVDVYWSMVTVLLPQIRVCVRDDDRGES